MSIEIISNQITSVDRETNNLERALQQIDTNIGAKQRTATDILGKISREKDIKKTRIILERFISKK